VAEVGAVEAPASAQWPTRCAVRRERSAEEACGPRAAPANL